MARLPISSSTSESSLEVFDEAAEPGDISLFQIKLLTRLRPLLNRPLIPDGNSSALRLILPAFEVTDFTLSSVFRCGTLLSRLGNLRKPSGEDGTSNVLPFFPGSISTSRIPCLIDPDLL